VDAYIDRTEGTVADGVTAIIMVGKAGILLVPTKSLKFKIYDGMRITLSFRPKYKSKRRLMDTLLRKKEK